MLLMTKYLVLLTKWESLHEIICDNLLNLNSTNSENTMTWENYYKIEYF